MEHKGGSLFVRTMNGDQAPEINMLSFESIECDRANTLHANAQRQPIKMQTNVISPRYSIRYYSLGKF